MESFREVVLEMSDILASEEDEEGVYVIVGENGERHNGFL